MARYIIECEDPNDIILGMECIKYATTNDQDSAILGFDDRSLWYVKKTKTGYSARTSRVTDNGA